MKLGIPPATAFSTSAYCSPATSATPAVPVSNHDISLLGSAPEDNVIN